MRPENGLFVLQVSDNGCGIDEEAKPRLFDPFFTTQANGTQVGLGLSIAKTIVEHHHGALAVESELGKFTRVTARIPLTQTQVTEKAA